MWKKLKKKGGLDGIKIETVTIPKEKFGKVLADVEVLIEDIEELIPAEDTTVKERISDVELNPSIGKTEEELDEYLKKRGVEID